MFQNPHRLGIGISQETVPKIATAHGTPLSPRQLDSTLHGQPESRSLTTDVRLLDSWPPRSHNCFHRGSQRHVVQTGRARLGLRSDGNSRQQQMVCAQVVVPPGSGLLVQPLENALRTRLPINILEGVSVGLAELLELCPCVLFPDSSFECTDRPPSRQVQELAAV